MKRPSEKLRDGIEALGHPLVDHVRGAGLLLGIVLTEPLAPQVQQAAQDAGFLVNAPAPDVVRLMPPLILGDDEVDAFLQALPGVLDAVSAATRRAGTDDPENETTMSQAQDHEHAAGPAVPQTRTARHRRIVDILNRQPVRSQSQLAKLLADDGLSVTQATLSRDLDELGAVKIRNTGGDLIYAVPSEGGFRTPRAPLGESAKEERMRRLSAGAADLRGGVGEPRGPAHPAGRRAVPRLGHRPGGAARHPRHDRG